MAHDGRKHEEVGSSSSQVAKKNTWSGMERQNEQRNGEATDRNGETKGDNNKEKTDGWDMYTEWMQTESQNKLKLHGHQYIEMGNEADQEKTGSQQYLRICRNCMWLLD